MSSGRGEIPHRRYSPRAFGQNRCNSGTDSVNRVCGEVWMEEDMSFLACDIFAALRFSQGVFLCRDIGQIFRKRVVFMQVSNSNRVKRLTVMAMLAAASVVLVAIIHVPIFPAVAFLEYDPADIQILIGTFFLGPAAGIGITIAASLIQGLTVSAQSGLYGIIMHIIATSTYVLMSGYVYRRLGKTSGAAAAGLAAGTAAMVIVMFGANLVITPYFTGWPVSAVLDLMPYILLFNLIKAGGNGVITFLVYKGAKTAMDR